MIFSDIFVWYSLLILIPILVSIYFYLTRNYDYWTSRGVDGPKPIIFFGTLYQNFLKSTPEVVFENTTKYGKIHGQFMGRTPVLSVADPELVKQITIRDFHLFVNRLELTTGDPMNDRSLLNLMGDEWRKMRSIVSPTFSAGKMRKMHPLVIDCIKRLEENLEKKALNEDLNEIELKKVMSNLTMDVIASCAFGTDVDVYNEDKPNEFVTNAEEVFKISFRAVVVLLGLMAFPRLIKWCGFQPTKPYVRNFFETAIKSIITRRQSERVKRKDYLQLMINAMNNGLDSMDEEVLNEDNSEQLFGDNEQGAIGSGSGERITYDDLMATSFIFFVAGYETTASLLSYLFYSLAINENCQQKLYEEVIKFGDDYSYETIARMSYLEACIAETLRLYNPVPTIGRVASEEYTIGDTGITITKGTLVNFDIQTLHHSPEYYPEPEKWDPERFMPENRDRLTPYTYLPFGSGPRNCVGMKFALMEAKTAVAYLVHKFSFVRTAKTTVPLTKPKKASFILNFGDLNVGIKLRETY